MTAVQSVHRDEERCYRAVMSRDPRFDGIFFTGVRTTGSYCRPSCPATTPRRHNVTFFATTAAAHAAGLRACRRCRPDAVPGSPEWDVRADTVGRAMRLIRDGVVEREGVTGLAARLGYSTRHLHRLMVVELGAGPLSIARAQRAHAARLLAETTDLPFADVAFAAGFSSVRQFNETMQEIYAATPSRLRARRGSRLHGCGHGRVRLRLAVRRPYAADAALAFLASRAVPGLEELHAGTYSRLLPLPHGTGVASLTPAADYVDAVLELSELRDLAVAVQRCRALLDLDADPVAVGEVLAADPALEPLVRTCPGIRVPGHIDGFELSVRAVLGQQVSVRRARDLVTAVVANHGRRLPTETGRLGELSTFPTPEQLAQADPATFGVPQVRGRAVVALAEAVADGRVELGPGVDRVAAIAALETVPGIGPWTAGYIAMRGLGDPDQFLAGDVVVRNAMRSLGLPTVTAVAAEHARRWRPWRSYAVMHLWRHASGAEPRGHSACLEHEEERP